MTGVDILNSLEADGILKVVSIEFENAEGRFEIRGNFVRLVELRGPVAWFNPLVCAVQRQLSAFQDKAWDDEGGWEGLDHSLSDSIARVSGEIGRHFHPISISQRAMRERKAAAGEDLWRIRGPVSFESSMVGKAIAAMAEADAS